MLKVILLTFSMSFILIKSPAQNDSIQNEIDQQVWKPFLEGFNSGDTEKFMSVHSKDMSRVLQDAGIIYGYDTYYENIKRMNNSAREKNRFMKLELRFIQRIAGNERGFETGYFKTTSTAPDSGNSFTYGKFHVLLIKENGSWKILMDADANEKTTEAIFLSGKEIRNN